MDWPHILTALALVTLIAGGYLAVLIDPAMKHAKAVQYAGVFVLVAIAVIACLLLTRPIIESPFSTINRSLCIQGSPCPTSLPTTTPFPMPTATPGWWQFFLGH